MKGDAERHRETVMSLSVYTELRLWAVKMLPSRDDWKKIRSGIQQLCRYLRTEKFISLSLSRFSSGSAVVKQGETNKYDFVLTNNTSRDSWAQLQVDIYLTDNQTHPVGHYAYFAKRIHITSKSSQRIGLVYDWNNRAFFDVEGLKLIPDHIWRGPCNAHNKYIVRALLKNDEGQPYEQLHLVQSLST